ncbi:MocR-like pyridoxine biosynthesis transcription factor PdxR [Shewanella surugensis]|uniref:PLP-dependent aminotransferase family protein n=1 Tax=Shewanella surugensis TaxID=212020 RepID=A0ABT0LIR0_9GAMM|nr:PLP-dependent aminotransferase family protein [Shewanella surugensis]MCL1127592.1 PLP-dependent aminotransferase family protein [Shewanella surugensis]
MTSLVLQFNNTIHPRFLRIAMSIKHAIQSGQLQPGETLPSTRLLAKQVNSHRHTVMTAYQELIAQGWLTSIERKAYQVNQDLPIENSQQSPNSVNPSAATFQWSLSPNVFTKATGQRHDKQPAHEFHYNFAGGQADLSLFPFQEFKTYLSDSLVRPDLTEFYYGKPAGTSLFIEQMTAYLRKARGIMNKDIIVVNGSQEALYLLSQVLLTPGDHVAVESLGYQPAWQAFQSAGAVLTPIKQHNKGIDIEALTTLVERQSIKLIYLTPLHQYPTTITLPIAERMAIYQLAAQHNIAIIEDDYDHEFHYDSQPPTPMASDDPQGLVIYLATFSKIMFPGGRLGFMAIDKTLTPALLHYRQIMNHKPNVLMQQAVGKWMQAGAFERHLRKMTKIYHQRRDHLVSLLNAYNLQSLKPVNFIVPAGGMALWLDVGDNAEALETYCDQNDIYLLSEKHFQLNPQKSVNHHVRIGFAGMSQEKLQQGLGIILNFIDSHPHSESMAASIVEHV